MSTLVKVESLRNKDFSKIFRRIEQQMYLEKKYKEYVIVKENEKVSKMSCSKEHK